MSLETVKSYISKQMGFARDSYLKDLEIMSEHDLINGMNGNERKPIDFSYEVAYVNRRFAKRISGETPEPWPDGGWITAPEAFRTKEAIINEVREATDVLINAWNAISPEDMTRVIPVPDGETSPLDLAFSMCWHNGYHDAQLNYLQELKGDMQMHWQD